MNCAAFEIELDDYLDGRLDPARRQAISVHLQQCAACRERHARAQDLLAALHALPAPASPRDLLGRMLKRAQRPRPSGRAWFVGAAVAASLVLGVALGVLYTRDGQPPLLATVALQLEQRETVRLRIRAPRDLQATTITLTLPENVELAGHAGRRSLTWKTDLRQGVNLLQLPLIAHGTPRGELVALLSQGEESRTVRVKLVLKPTGGVS